MAFDVIVFSQSELDEAIKCGITRIALCDNRFTLPDVPGIEYTHIGNVEIEGAASVDKPPVYANVERKTLSHAGSFASSYGGSYALGSYASGSGGSYSYGYKYEYGGSYASSYNSSYAMLYSSSYMSSYASLYMSSYMSSYSYSFASSYSSSYQTSYATSYAGGMSWNTSYGGSELSLPDIIEYGCWGIIFVNGYGINLI